MLNSLSYRITLCTCLAVSLISCSTQRKLEEVKSMHMTAGLEMAPQLERSPYEIDSSSGDSDTLVVKGLDGKDIFIMKAVRDESSGEMMASDVIGAAVISATFRNIAERDGRISIDFRITVPSGMTDSKWQMRLTPEVRMLGERIPLDEVIVTGNSFRKVQMHGYRRYDKYLGTIVDNPEAFVARERIGLFSERNCFGISDEEILDHYTDKARIRRNENRRAKSGKMFRKYVKVPLNEDARIDTLFSGVQEFFSYDYSQPILARPGLRKLSVVVSGAIFEGDQKLYDIPEGDSITFYVSSLGTLVDSEAKYLTRVIERKVEAEASCRIAFAPGKSEIIREMGSNAGELDKIQATIADLVRGGEYILDSIVTAASSSPDGNLRLNGRLSQERGRSVNDYLKKAVGDSVLFVTKCSPENWELLSHLVNSDTTLSPRQKRQFNSRMSIRDEDLRENAMRSDSYFGYIREKLYPQLRTVTFDFHMHRRGMLKDTIQTSVLDTVYMDGVQAIRDGHYARAAEILGKYKDFNTAVAYCSLGKNHTACAILESLEENPKVDYMLAIIHSRLGHDREAVQHYLLACERNPSYMHRGNLDPEISSLINKYNLGATFQ